MTVTVGGERRDSMHLRRRLPGTHHARLLQILHRGDQSRADLARRLGLTKATISILVAELLELGLVVESSQQPIEGRGRPGRDLSLAWTGWNIVAVDLSDDLEFRGAVVDLTGRPLVSRSIPRDGDTGEVAAEKAETLVDSLIQDAAAPILGIGICVPGTVDLDGVVVASNYLEWSHLPLRALTEERTGLPVSVANDANAAALAESDVHRHDDLILVKMGTGVGAGITANGRSIYGPHLTAGEIGHIAIDADDDIRCICGRTGCLEAMVSIPRLEARLASAENDAAREEVLRAAGNRLGVALAPLIGALGMDYVVVSGPPQLLEGTFMTAARDALRPRLMPELLETLDFHLSDLGEGIMLRGAAIIVLRSVLGFA